MKKKKKMVVWPIYFDSSKTRREGRKIPKNIAVSNPNLVELQKAAESLGFNPETELELAHPAIPWQRTGRMLVLKKEGKPQTLKKLAKELSLLRQKD